MSLYKEIAKYSDYLFSIRKIKGYISIDMAFPDKWVVPKITSDDFEVLNFDVPNNGYIGISFVALISEPAINSAMTSVNKIIRYNKEKEQKEKLFKQTNEKLKAIFDGSNIDKLKKLKITFDEDETSLIQKEINQDEQINTGTTVTELVGEAEKK